MRVGVVTTSYPRFPDDPAGNFVGEHVRALRDRGHNVEVIAAGDESSDAGERDDEVRDADEVRDIDDVRDVDEVHDADNGRAFARTDSSSRSRLTPVLTSVRTMFLRALEPRLNGVANGEVRVPSAGLFYTGGAPDLLERSPTTLASAAVFSTRLALAIARRSRRWDTIVAHWLAPSALACAIAAPRTPLLAIAHGGDVHTLRRLGLLAPVLHLLRARGAHLVFVSEELRAIAIEAVPRLNSWLAESRVQPMGIDVARFASIRRSPSNPLTVMVAARLVPLKGVDVAIAAMKRLNRRARLAIAGTGPESPRLARAAFGDDARPYCTHSDVTNIEQRHGIAFHGALDTRERDRLLGEASIVLVPSRIVGGRSEGTPLIALEALAAGIPVIASAVGGLRTLRGVELVPPDDPEALARTIDRVLDAPPDSAKLRESVAHLDWRRVVDTLVRSV